MSASRVYSKIKIKKSRPRIKGSKQASNPFLSSIFMRSGTLYSLIPLLPPLGASKLVVSPAHSSYMITGPATNIETTPYGTLYQRERERESPSIHPASQGGQQAPPASQRAAPSQFLSSTSTSSLGYYFLQLGLSGGNSCAPDRVPHPTATVMHQEAWLSGWYGTVW